MRRIYMDHAATTSTDPKIVDMMIPYFSHEYGNPSSTHSFGRSARIAVDRARNIIASIINAGPEEVIFTSGGSESDNLAIIGAAEANTKKGKHIVTTSVEHHASLDSVLYLKRAGYDITFLPVDGCGMINLESLDNAIREDTVLVSVIHANNEVGSIQSVNEIRKIIENRDILFHLDSVQAVGAMPIDVKKIGVDLLSASAHKFYGPKGCGFLYKRKGVAISPRVFGGKQENALRAGTENLPGIIGTAEALSLAADNMEIEAKRQSLLRDRLISDITERVEGVKLNGHPCHRLPNNVNLCFSDINGKSLLTGLDRKGIAASGGSACASGSFEPSHVLTAMGIPPDLAQGSLRLTLGRETTSEDVDYVVDALVELIPKLREAYRNNLDDCDCVKRKINGDEVI